MSESAELLGTTVRVEPTFAEMLRQKQQTIRDATPEFDETKYCLEIAIFIKDELVKYAEVHPHAWRCEVALWTPEGLMVPATDHESMCRISKAIVSQLKGSALGITVKEVWIPADNYRQFYNEYIGIHAKLQSHRYERVCFGIRALDINWYPRPLSPVKARTPGWFGW